MLLALSSRTGAGLLGAPLRRLGAGRSSADCPAVEPHPLTPHGPPPGKSLGQGVDLVVVTPRESKKFGREGVKPGCTLGSRTEPPANRSDWAIRRERLSVSGSYVVTLIELSSRLWISPLLIACRSLRTAKVG